MGTSPFGATIIHFATAKRKMREQLSKEQRQERRWTCRKRMYTQVVECDDSELIGATTSCVAVNASANGFRIKGDLYMPENTLLDMWVDTSSGLGKYLLTSNVRWSRPTADGKFEMGVSLQDDAATDIDAWRKYST